MPIADKPPARPPHRLAVVRTTAAWLAIAGAAGARQDDGPAPVDPVFTTRLAEGGTATGRLLAIDVDGGFTLAALGDGREVRLAPDRMFVLQRDGVTPPAFPEGPAILFPDGDRLRAAVASADDTRLKARSSILGEVSPPLTSVAALILGPPPESDALPALRDALLREPGGNEVAWLANGDRSEGAYLGLTADALLFRTEAGVELKLPRGGLRALSFDAKLVDYPAPDRPWIECWLTDGSRLGLREARLEKGSVTGTARFGEAVRIPLGEVARLGPRGPGIVYLSDREPDGKQAAAYVGVPRPHRRDRNVEGSTLSLGRQPYDRGLGVPSRTLLAYRLAPEDRRFQAVVGLDDRAGPLGSVTFRVLLDGREAFASPALGDGDAPLAIDLELDGARLLILEADFGDRGDVRDYADWVDARLVRSARDPRE